ncbi:hypothetical protein D9757_006903 [Collybiopsis confluens]|uniref:Uncharacterized protein n=1 Tax=Collybiopsis confluens TaxID=2823264 RepID=A0A8H5HPR4_9AGAR|nr:hypothetical protein D9757_006903 [Collybiopsis confluens]
MEHFLLILYSEYRNGGLSGFLHPSLPTQTHRVYHPMESSSRYDYGFQPSTSPLPVHDELLRGILLRCNVKAYKLVSFSLGECRHLVKIRDSATVQSKNPVLQPECSATQVSETLSSVDTTLGFLISACLVRAPMSRQHFGRHLTNAYG